MDANHRVKEQGHGRPPSRSGFTLIELMAVMIIMGIMMGLAVLGVQSISTHMAVRHGAGGVQAALGAARQHAITTSTRAYVLFFRPDTDFSGLEDLRHLAGRGYAVYAVEPASGRAYFLTEWRSLPEGVVFDTGRTSGDSVFADTPASRATGVEIKRDDFETSGAFRSLTLDAVAFRPTGATYSRSGYTVPLIEGWVEVDADTGLPAVRPKEGASTARVVVRAVTGTARVEMP